MRALSVDETLLDTGKHTDWGKIRKMGGNSSLYLPQPIIPLDSFGIENRIWNQ